MRTLYLECSMGAAGDMLTAALLELCDREKFIHTINSLGLPETVISAQIVSKCGIDGTQMNVRVNGAEEESRDAHEGEDHHEHEHGHHHEHRSLGDIIKLINGLNVSEKVRADAVAVYKLLAEAESHAHGQPVEEIHFHEVGTLDAVADIVGVCLLMETVSPEKVIVSPVNVGSGHVRCAHGILPVPAPAAAYLLRGIPMYGSGIECELCTPTGAALIRYFADDFGDMPVMRMEKTGYGFGRKELPKLNCVRAFLGESGSDAGKVVELKCNIDDMTPEDIGFAVGKLSAAGALDVFTAPVYMKKNRPAVLLTVICREDMRDSLVKEIFRCTSTIGIRQTVCERFVLERSESVCYTDHGEIHIKNVSGYGVTRSKPEFDDIAAIAEKCGTSLQEIREKLNL